jgi:hypothetical protein
MVPLTSVLNAGIIPPWDNLPVRRGRGRSTDVRAADLAATLCATRLRRLGRYERRRDGTEIGAPTADARASLAAPRDRRVLAARGDAATGAEHARRHGPVHADPVHPAAARTRVLGDARAGMG